MPRRIEAIDGLRGVAATWVVLIHLWGAIHVRDIVWVPDFFRVFLEHGYLGVDIFFVISGFVIALSTDRGKHNLHFIGNFLLRRSLRIDPPYWATIILALCFLFLKDEVFPQFHQPGPPWRVVLAHVFYLQDLLGYKDIVAPFWTLCLEFQFYLFFSLASYLVSKVSGHLRLRMARHFTSVAFLVIFSFSILTRCDILHFVVEGTVFPYLYEFMVGVGLYECIKGKLPAPIFFICILFAVVIPFFDLRPSTAITPVLTIVLVYLGWMGHKTGLVLRLRPVQFLGRISYSLYLTHAIVGWSTITFMSHFLVGWPGVVATCLIFLSGFLASVMFAIFFHQWVELPSVAMSHRFKINGSGLRKVSDLRSSS